MTREEKIAEIVRRLLGTIPEVAIFEAARLHQREVEELALREACNAAWDAALERAVQIVQAELYDERGMSQEDNGLSLRLAAALRQEAHKE